MEKITNEMRAKIFAAYLGSRIATNIKVCESGYMEGVVPTGIYLKPDDGSSLYVPFYNCQLILRQLSEITDEDVMTVFNMASGEQSYSPNKDTPNSCVVRWIENESLNTKQADYLRSKSYALPYMGICPIESGIAIHQTHPGHC